ncbi:MAG: hypothetical protein IJF67_01670, partial [Clostridia bacterium]|nr:hypothetical protein [Clostridia bacterium]
MKLTINTNETVGRIKPMHAAGQPPLGGRGKNFFEHFHYLTEIGTPFSRLHDVGGAYGRNQFVDIPNIFRDFNADADDPASYDFTFTDALITALVEAGIEPYYRLGVTIENQAEIKPYRIYPPADYDKWASICEHIIAHYIDGWADGYHYNLRYWEIWNEPDDGHGIDGRFSQMWLGTAEDYYRLYDVTAKRLKARFPQIKVGGYAAIGFYAIMCDPNHISPRSQYCLDFFHGFIRYVKEHNSPIDFFSWHSYSLTTGMLQQAEWLHQTLVDYGFGELETHLNEWNPVSSERGTAHHSAEVAAAMLGMQNQPGVDMLMIYDARMSGGQYMALFNPMTLKPFHAYYSLAAFNQLYKLGTQVSLTCDTDRVYAVAATNGKKHALMISNISGKAQSLEIEGADLTDARWYVLDQQRLLSWSPAVKTIENNAVVL